MKKKSLFYNVLQVGAKTAAWVIHFIGFQTLLLSLLPATSLPAADTLRICRAEEVQLAAAPGFATYHWQPQIGLNNPTIFNPLAKPESTTTYIVEAIFIGGPNLVVNGDFRDGNSGFSSQYIFSPAANPTQGVYGVFADANQLSPNYFEHCKDHTTGTGPMMVADGSPLANQEVWCQVIPVDSNRTYAFSTWITSISPSNPAMLRFSINDEQIGATFTAGTQPCQWRQFYELWDSGTATEAEICIVNRNTNPNGNDFALDDIVFFEIGETLYDTITVVVNQPLFTQIDTTFCAGETIEFEGEQIPVNLSFSLIYTAQTGCDSVVYYNAEIVDTVVMVNRVDTLCPGDILPYRGHLLDRDTILCETVSAPTSCDTTFCLQVVFLTKNAIEAQMEDPSCFEMSDGRIGVTATAGVPPFIYQWDNGSSLTDRMDLGAGSYQVTVRDAKGCMANRSFELMEPEMLVVQANAGSTICNGEIEGKISFSSTGGTAPYQYSVDGGQSFQMTNQFSTLLPGDYPVVTRDARGCVYSSLVNIPQPRQVSLDVPLMRTINLGETIRASVSDNATTDLTYEWIPAAGVACPTCAETELMPLQTTLYTIRAINDLGCVVEAYWQVEVTKDLSVYVPNAFSPNGDGVNDDFRLYPAFGVESILDFSVYDRWGNILFLQSNCDAACAWDGRKDSALMEQGVYVFVSRLRYLDGEERTVYGEVVLLH